MTEPPRTYAARFLALFCKPRLDHAAKVDPVVTLRYQ
jgi:hypothetical protein